MGPKSYGESHDNLILVCADGTRWESINSSAPIGSSNSALASGIRMLLASSSPQEFHAWQGEKMALFVGTVFLAPAALLLFALLLRIVLPRSLVERQTAALERAMIAAEERRAKETSRSDGGAAGH